MANPQKYCGESKVTFLREPETTANFLVKQTSLTMHQGAFGWLSFSPLITSLLKKARGQEPFLFSVVILTWSFLQ